MAARASAKAKTSKAAAKTAKGRGARTTARKAPPKRAAAKSAKPTAAKPLPVLKSDETGFAGRFGTLCERDREIDTSAEREALKAIDAVREAGDEALLAAAPGVERLEIDRNEWDEACETVDGADRAALGKAAMRIREFHRKRIPSSWEMREEGGAFLGQRARALDRVGLVAAAEKPIEILMNAIPASCVEVPEICLAAPPGRGGQVSAQLLMAAKVAGVHRVFRMSGAHAVAAFALGTDAVPRADKIVGLADDAATAAKQLLARQVAVDDDRGPGELLILADRSATPAWLAADLLSQAERGAVPRTLLVTHTKALVTRVQEQVAKQLKAHPQGKEIQARLAEHGTVLVTRNLQESITLANRYAPELVLLALEDPEGSAKQIVNAGTVLMGHYTPVAVGAFLAGPNQVLPGGGRARFRSPLGVEDFMKRWSFVKFEPPKLRELGTEAMRLAGIEGLAAGTNAVDLRLQKIRRARREREAAREAELEV